MNTLVSALIEYNKYAYFILNDFSSCF